MAILGVVVLLVLLGGDLEDIPDSPKRPVRALTSGR